MLHPKSRGLIEEFQEHVEGKKKTSSDYSRECSTGRIRIFTSSSFGYFQVAVEVTESLRTFQQKEANKIQSLQVSLISVNAKLH